MKFAGEADKKWYVACLAAFTVMYCKKTWDSIIKLKKRLV
jgi:hypothetical protein